MGFLGRLFRRNAHAQFADYASRFFDLPWDGEMRLYHQASEDNLADIKAILALCTQIEKDGSPNVPYWQHRIHESALVMSKLGYDDAEIKDYMPYLLLKHTAHFSPEACQQAEAQIESINFKRKSVPVIFSCGVR